MLRTSRISAGILMLTILSGVLSAESVPVMTQHGEQAARCHGSLPEKPAPKPASFRCCVTGHHWAIPERAMQQTLLQPGLEPHQTDQFASEARPFLRGNSSSDSPPNPLPLRI